MKRYTVFYNSEYGLSATLIKAANKKEAMRKFKYKYKNRPIISID